MKGVAVACRVKGSEEYAELSKQCLVDMMKASKLRGKAGQFGLLMATALLIRSLLDSAYGLMGKSPARQAEQILLEAQQVQLPLSQGRLCQSALCVPYFHAALSLLQSEDVCCPSSTCRTSHHKAVSCACVCLFMLHGCCF